jgi:hypothetical protein
MTRLRTPARHACWSAAFLAGGPWLWLGSFLLERHPADNFAYFLERAKLHANLWLLAGGVIWYAAWSFGTLLLPRHTAGPPAPARPAPGFRYSHRAADPVRGAVLLDLRRPGPA